MCQERIKETGGDSSLARTAGVTARGGAKTAWYMSTTDSISSSHFPDGL